MSPANRLWGAPRIHGELLKLGIEVAQSTVARYMARRGRGPSQTWNTFLRNHTAGIAATDFLIVSTIGFRLVLVVLRHQRRRLISLSVTANPTAEWIARQTTDAFPWNEAPDYLIRDRDASYGHAVARRLCCHGHPRSPDRPTVTMAERACGETDRLDPQGVPRSHLLSSARPTCAGSWRPAPAITTNCERICRWEKIHRAVGRSNGSASSLLS
jgi:hypothetical protein